MANASLSLGERLSITSNRPWFTNLKIFVVALALALAGAVVGSKFGLLMVVVGAGALFVVIALVVGTRLWWYMLYFLLTGYMFASRGFAGLGFFPLYVGEIGLLLGILTVVLAPFSRRIVWQGASVFVRPEFFSLVFFLMWSVYQTVPYIGEYQIDAIRDAMTYGYALFALIIMAAVPKSWVERFIDFYGRIIVYAVTWFPFFFFFSRMDSLDWLRFPGASHPLFYTKGTDVGVHLAGIAAFLLLGLDKGRYPRWMMWYVWIMWMISVVFYGSFGRSNFLVALVAVAIVFILRPLKTRFSRPLLIVVLAGCFMLITNTYSTLEIDIGADRKISAEQLVNNVISIFGEGNNATGSLEATKQWRLEWWDDIVNYTFFGDYYWMGKGYGVNLADDDGYQVSDDGSLRSPHNGHMTILARSGVPGFALWILFLALFGLLLFRKAVFGAALGATPYESRVAVWMLAYFIAFILMASFDVFLEGPMGGIWFWALIGLGFTYFLRSGDVVDPQEKLAAQSDTVQST